MKEEVEVEGEGGKKTERKITLEKENRHVDEKDQKAQKIRMRKCRKERQEAQK